MGRFVPALRHELRALEVIDRYTLMQSRDSRISW